MNVHASGMHGDDGDDHMNIHTPHLRGVVPPIVLPMTRDGELDSSSLDALVTQLVGAGVHGLWVNGTTGEFYALDAELRTRVVRECVKAADERVPVVAHVGDTSTALAVRHAREATAAGASAVSVLPPYFVGFSQGELKDHFRAVAHAAGGPVLAYHLPQFAPVTLTIDSIVELAAEGVLSGAKDSSSDVVWFRQLARRLREAGVPIPCLTGGSSVADVGYMLGAVGSVSSIGNLVPRHLVRQYEAARDQDWAAVLRLQEQSEELIALLRPPGTTPTPSLTTAVYKYLLAATDVIGADHAAAPQLALSVEAREHLQTHALPFIDQLERVGSALT